MRLLAGVVVLVTVAAGRAEASSFVTLGGGPAKTPSITALGAPDRAAAVEAKSMTVLPGISPAPQAEAAAALARRISTSVIALGEPLPAVSGEAVAAIGDAKKSAPNRAPMVIRGGLVGNTAPARESSAASPERKLSRPQQRKLERDQRRAMREGRLPAGAGPEAKQQTSEAAPSPAAAQPAAPPQKAR